MPTEKAILFNGAVTIDASIVDLKAVKALPEVSLQTLIKTDALKSSEEDKEITLANLRFRQPQIDDFLETLFVFSTKNERVAVKLLIASIVEAIEVQIRKENQ